MPSKYKPRLWKRSRHVGRVWEALEMGARTNREIRAVHEDLTPRQVASALASLREKCRVRIVRSVRGVDTGKVNVYEICK